MVFFMKILGLCGGSGSGKGTVANIFSYRGIPAIDTDVVYHSLISGFSVCVRELADNFGEEILTADGAVDRRRLAKIVFSDESGSNQRKLNAITHKHVIDKVKKMLPEFESEGVPAVLIDAPMLFESGLDKICNRVIAVVADKNVRIARIIIRDGITYEDAEKRLASQISDAELISKCDYVIENNGDINDLEPQVDEIIKKIK